MTTAITFTDVMDRPFDLISMGRVAVDLYAEQIGSSLAMAQSFRKYLGGCAGNIAVGAARLGCNVSMLSCVGNDEFGTFLKHELREEGVDISALQTSVKHLTGLAVLGVCPPDRFPLIFFRNDCADMAISPNQFSKEYFSRAKALLVTGTGLSNEATRNVTRHAIKLARSVNAKIILDIDYRPVLWGLLPPGDGENRYVASCNASMIIRDVLPLVDLIVGTEEECQIAGGNNDLSLALKQIHTKSNAPVVMKRGSRGAQCFIGGNAPPIEAPPFAISVVNVLGAGDAFMAGLLSRLVRGYDMHEALIAANACGAMVVSRHGCSHSCPSQAELNYFIANAANHNVMASKPIERMHQNIVLKDTARQEPMPVFAFCHRWQLEEHCTKYGVSLKEIAVFKTALAEAFHDACVKNAIPNPWLLCDTTYGQGALLHAAKIGVGAIVAIERSGVPLIEWEGEQSAYEILHTRPSTWGVKLLAQIHNELSTNDMAHQLQRLHEISRACRKLDRKLMLEVIVPNHMGDDAVVQAVSRVYREGIFPYWWKLRRFEERDAFLRLGSIIDEYDSCARLLFLGGDTKDLNHFKHDFSIAKASHHGIGFAVGRAIFWPSFCAFVEKRSSLAEIQAQVAERINMVFQMWRDA